MQVVHLASPGKEVPPDSAQPMVDDETEKCFVDIFLPATSKVFKALCLQTSIVKICSFDFFYFPMC